MSRARGNKTSGAKRAERQAKAVEMMNSGAKQQEIIAALGISRMTFWRDLQNIEARYVAGSAEDIQQFREAQYKALMQIESATAEGTIPPDVANALTRIRSEVSKLLGLNAPERSIKMNVSSESSPLFLKFKKATHGLSESQMEEVFESLGRIPREARSEVRDASWFPSPEPKLLEGES